MALFLRSAIAFMADILAFNQLPFACCIMSQRKLNILNAIKKNKLNTFAPPNFITKQKKTEVDLMDFGDTKYEGGENIRISQ